MTQQQRLVGERRRYNQWVASETLEDYALRFTAEHARRSPFRVANTALGPLAFLACEAIGAGITVAYGFQNAAWAIGAFSLLMLLIGLPIGYYASRYGVDIDLLTRGAGFGYLGSTITSLIYASFTFLLFSIEAGIMSVALHAVLHISLSLSYIISSLIVIPFALYGISWISRMQLATQPIWLVLQFVPLIYIAMHGGTDIDAWVRYPGRNGGPNTLTFASFGMAVSILLSLLPQIGEQVDYLRFLPKLNSSNRRSWWSAMLVTGPGWVLMGAFKLLAGSFLVVLALRHGQTPDHATQPSAMYLVAFSETVRSPTVGLVLVGVFVIVCQFKINTTNAYAGSIAWSNFFSRLTHRHPGRAVWLIFNVALALLLLEMGILTIVEGILRIYANFAVGWLGALAADLLINKPLGLSPPHIEFKRAHLYDINPVGVGALLASIVASSLAFLGAFGGMAQILSPFIGLSVAFVVAPIIAWATNGKYYIARKPDGLPGERTQIRCTICENEFDRSDMAMCPAYSGPICSLCCSLEVRCGDMCKTNSRFTEQVTTFLKHVLPLSVSSSLHSRTGRFAAVFLAFTLSLALVLAFIYHPFIGITPAERDIVRTTLWIVFLTFTILSAVIAWLVVLTYQTRRAAEMESARQTGILLEEISAHKRTDAALKKAREVAEAANVAKTRYIVGISHELRTPLNSISGYAQLLERNYPAPMETAVRIIRRSSEHLSDLVDGLLDISRIENGLLRLNRDAVHLPEFLEQIVDMFRLQAAAKGIGFQYQRVARLPVNVHTDRKRLRQILINLMSNAIKYTESGHASLSVRCQSQVVEFEISDTGIGIKPEDLERIFEPFERGSMPGARSIPGTGLGLTITKLLTQIMGGELLVRSEPGEGTTFTIRLMLSEASNAAIVASPRKIRGYVGPRLSVLIADDNPAHLELIRNLLEPLGFTAIVATNGRACVELAQLHQPALVILDISMPDMTGLEVAAELRGLPRNPQLRILVVSANAHEYSSGAQGTQPYDEFIMKPFDIQFLLNRVGQLLAVEWLYEPLAEIIKLTDEPVGAPSDAALHHVEDLYRLGRIGHVRGIEAKLKEMETEDAANVPFAAHLRALVSNFDLKRYMSVLAVIRRGKENNAP